jgi:hypothetical protein
MNRRPPCEDWLVLDEATSNGVVDSSWAQEQSLAAIAGEDLEPALSLIAEPPDPSAAGAIRDNGPEAVVFSGGKDGCPVGLDVIEIADLTDRIGIGSQLFVRFESI